MTDLPPLGTRWGDLTREQRASLPVGTVLDGGGFMLLDLVLHGDGWRLSDDGSMTVLYISPNRRILSYPENPHAR